MVNATVRYTAATAVLARHLGGMYGILLARIERCRTSWEVRGIVDGVDVGPAD